MEACIRMSLKEKSPPSGKKLPTRRLPVMISDNTEIDIGHVVEIFLHPVLTLDHIPVTRQ